MHKFNIHYTHIVPVLPNFSSVKTFLYFIFVHHYTHMKFFQYFIYSFAWHNSCRLLFAELLTQFFSVMYRLQKHCKLTLFVHQNTFLTHTHTHTVHKLCMTHKMWLSTYVMSKCIWDKSSLSSCILTKWACVFSHSDVIKDCCVYTHRHHN